MVKGLVGVGESARSTNRPAWVRAARLRHKAETKVLKDFMFVLNLVFQMVRGIFSS